LPGGKLRAQHSKVLHENSLGGNLDDGVNGVHPRCSSPAGKGQPKLAKVAAAFRSLKVALDIQKAA
jgi:hypothetical protein